MRSPAVPIVVGFLLLFGALAVAQDLSSPESGASAASVTSNPSPLSKAAKTYHDGSLRDIDAIGNRKVGCDRGL
ncbi:MAG TPA: hypothetical protein VN948_09150, partial [Terriglobales bacterium]|nr:hypothetical protein [Terriglobales bacterium]